MRSRSDLKTFAKQAMRGNTGWLILAMVAYTVLEFAGSILTDTLFPGTELSDIVLSQIFLFILMLLFNVFYAGVSYLYLNVARGRQYSMEDMIYFFKHNPDHVIVAAFVVTLINVAASLPINIYTYYADAGTTWQSQMDWALNTLLFMLLAVVISELLVLPFEMIYYLLADHPEMSGAEALKGSWRMLKGKMGKLLLLKISFIPLMVLSVFTLYIALLWVIPYKEMTTAMFYRDLLGEFDVNPQIPLQQNETGAVYPGDDFNSEA